MPSEEFKPESVTITEANESDGFILPPSDESKRKPRIPSRRRRKLILVGIIVAVFSVPIALAVWDYSACPLMPILPAGTSVSIAAGGHIEYAFDVMKVLNIDRPIYGSLTSSGAVVVYVATAQQFSYWTPTGSPGPYEFSSGPVTSLSYSSCGGKYESPCPPNSLAAPLGEDYLVLRDLGQTAITVVIGAAMVVQIC